ERSGDDAAMSGALQVQCLIAVSNDLARADALAEASWRHAVASGDGMARGVAAGARFRVIEASGDLRRLLEVQREQAEWEFSQGQVLVPSCDLTCIYLDLGDLRGAESSVRRGLTGTGVQHEEAEIRIFAALLASRHGDDPAARQHLARAREVLPSFEDQPRSVRGRHVADLFMSLGEAGKAFDLVDRSLPEFSTNLFLLDALLVRGARAAAELVQQAADRRDQDAVRRHRKALDGLVARRGELSDGPAFRPSNPADSQQVANGALFAAAAARARGVQSSSLWLEAADACAAAGMEWDQRSAQLRAAELLVESGAPGHDVAKLLREVLAYADRQGAVPLTRRVEELASSARVSLTEPVTARPDAVPAPFAGLTAREAEVLAHLVANRTYAEIAAALFISEKTVSVHVSNLLRKTGTRSGREVSALARRVGFVATAGE
ncbi:MAG: LuxR C-terminal-related transcriptional regulator, partial [Nocardioides sp.]